jgi:Uma2 family endonuclease
MSTSTATLVTFEQFEAMPSVEWSKQELIEGELITVPPPELPHARAARRIGRLLDKHLAGVPGMSDDQVYVETGYLIPKGPGSWLVPDVSVTHINQPGEKYLEGAPMLAVEVVSKSNTVRKIARKVEIYFENGAREIWVVYPKTATIVVHYAGDPTVVRCTDRLISRLFPGFSPKIEDILKS